MKRAWIAVNLVFGPLVLVSYVVSAKLWGSDIVGGLWGAVPEAARTPYVVNMFFAAAGYFAFSTFLLRTNAAHLKVGRFGFGVFTLAYTLVLVGSCLWMPLTCLALEAGDPRWVPWIVLVLWSVAVGSLGVFAGLLLATPREKGRTLALVGAFFFCLQTVVLDGIIWPLNFSI